MVRELNLMWLHDGLSSKFTWDPIQVQYTPTDSNEKRGFICNE